MYVPAQPTPARVRAAPALPGPIREHREADMARHREADTGEVDRARVDAVRERDQERDGHGVRGVEETRDPARPRHWRYATRR